MIKTIFFGTHTFATVILQALFDDPAIQVSLVITQPDKPVGRKKVMTPPPVKTLAIALGIPVVQPQSLKGFELPDTYDIGVTAQYGLLVPKHILETPTHGILNVHTSLLPKYRGASPIQSALISGETQTGVTIMNMDVGLDTGPILLQKSLSITPDDTYEILDQKLATIAAPALIEALKAYIAGTLAPTSQDDTKATHCYQFCRDDGRVDWNQSTTTIYNLYRGLTPWPGIWTTIDGKRLKLLDISPSDSSIPAGTIAYDHDTIYIGTSDASVVIRQIQIEGKPVMTASQFVQGYVQYNRLMLGE
jgi:methionyl-tRNA formyltransferase